MGIFLAKHFADCNCRVNIAARAVYFITSPIRCAFDRTAGTGRYVCGPASRKDLVLLIEELSDFIDSWGINFSYNLDLKAAYTIFTATYSATDIRSFTACGLITDEQQD